MASSLELHRCLFIRPAAERAHAEPLPVRSTRLEPAVASDRLGIASRLRQGA